MRHYQTQFYNVLVKKSVYFIVAILKYTSHFIIKFETGSNNGTIVKLYQI